MSKLDEPVRSQDFETFKETIKNLDPQAFETDTVESCGKWFKFLCDRYGLPAEAVYPLPISKACGVLTFACRAKVKSPCGFVLCPKDTFCRVIANCGVPPILSGVRVRLLAEWAHEGVYFVQVADKESSVFENRVFLYKHDLQKIGKKTRVVDVDD